MLVTVGVRTARVSDRLRRHTCEGVVQLVLQFLIFYVLALLFYLHVIGSFVTPAWRRSKMWLHRKHPRSFLLSVLVRIMQTKSLAMPTWTFHPKSNGSNECFADTVLALLEL